MSTLQSPPTTPAALRQLCRNGQLTGPTPGLAPGFAQANLVILPQAYAFDFLLFCQRNPKPCPILDVTDLGSPAPGRIAPGADIRRDLPRYRVFHGGQLTEERTDISDIWREDFIAFLIGCSFTFEGAMVSAGLPMRHVEEGKNVPMYRTNLTCQPAGLFSAPLVVSMRPLPRHQVMLATEVTSRYPRVHGSPIHIGDPAAIGIHQLDRPDYGDAVTIHADEVPVFWACGVTTQQALLTARPEIAITHAPGHMFISDVTNDRLSLLAAI